VTYLLVDSTLLQAFHLISISGTVSNKVMSRLCPSLAENKPCLWATCSSCYQNHSNREKQEGPLQTHRHDVDIKRLTLFQMCLFLQNDID
jgi:hypothetical protein